MKNLELIIILKLENVLNLVHKINLHAYDNIIKPGAKIPKPGTGDICFISDIDILEWEKIFHNNQSKLNLDLQSK